MGSIVQIENKCNWSSSSTRMEIKSYFCKLLQDILFLYKEDWRSSRKGENSAAVNQRFRIMISVEYIFSKMTTRYLTNYRCQSEQNDGNNEVRNHVFFMLINHSPLFSG
jgi:hypothetical protein